MRDRVWMHGWKGLVLGLVTGLILTLGIVFVVSQASGSDSRSSGYTEGEVVEDEIQLVATRKQRIRRMNERIARGDFGRYYYKGKWNKKQKRKILNKMEKAWNKREQDRYLKSIGAVRTSYRGAYQIQPFRRKAQWRLWNDRQDCSGGVRTGYPTNIACKVNNAHLLSGPYWTKRSELQNKWTIRVLWCGGNAVVAFWTAGSSMLTIGHSGSTCIGSFFIK